MSRTLIHVTDNDVVDATGTDPSGSFPLVIKATRPGIAVSEWAADHRDLVEARLLTHGAILFRGFHGADHHALEDFNGAIQLELMPYMEGATPRTQVGAHVYTSTEFPPEHAIALHNELSYVLTWPMKIIFFCITPAAEGGETPIADGRRVLERIPPAIRDRFAEKGWMLVRNFGDRLGLPWQRAYRTSNRTEFEQYAAEARVLVEWKNGGRLRTRQVRPAIAVHPRTGDPVWFNHIAFWHASSLPADVRELLVAEFGEDGLPYNTYYGDGSPIEDAVVEVLRAAYDAETVAEPWNAGDLLLADNMLVAHGRRPFSGPRKIIVSMGEPHTRIPS
jgi:alpha-ketoglutarate-dependent taurine dioxygenase